MGHRQNSRLTHSYANMSVHTEVRVGRCGVGHGHLRCLQAVGLDSGNSLPCGLLQELCNRQLKHQAICVYVRTCFGEHAGSSYLMLMKVLVVRCILSAKVSSSRTPSNKLRGLLGNHGVLLLISPPHTTHTGKSVVPETANRERVQGAQQARPLSLSHISI